MPPARPLNRPSAPVSAVVVSSTYEDLLRKVRSALFTGRANIEYACPMMFHDIELPRSEMVEKMRLRGIDCPEMNTAEGKAAKRFVAWRFPL
ncbi:MAG: hypothetical protein HY736_11550 [Verrucomicrobia bacterium]|nr:hypothetical protein [Verrucomicrobiota bacterium]